MGQIVHVVPVDEDDCEAPMHDALVALQSAHAMLRDGGGSVVVVLDAEALRGRRGPMAAAAARGVEALVISAARQWDGIDVAVTCIAGAGIAAGDPVVASIAAQPRLSGQTIFVDGAAW